jgi:UDP-N-acetylglucosamine--N-acetylmuramyl-(pentapeptide) pyrophosphoryl-undecaprenol N-acetylglucosamine transferase
MTDSGAIIALAAGGTGGHLFPAEALAQELIRRGRAVVLFSDARARDYAAGFPCDELFVVPSATLALSRPLSIVPALWKLLRGTARSWLLLRRVGPGTLVSFGGYPTLPPVFAAALADVPVVLHEQNAVLGRANGLAARWARAVASSFPEIRNLPAVMAGKLVFTGNPVRDAVLVASAVAYDPPVEGGPFHLLVFGGSQGARAFSEIIPAAIGRLDDGQRARLRLVHQCRPEDLEAVRTAYAGMGVLAELNSFFEDMPARIAGAQLVISRAGASTVSEIAAIGRPAILVPYPHALDHDQRANAGNLASTGGARVMEEKDMSPQDLTVVLGGYMENTGELEAMAARARRAGQPAAVKKLADLAEKMADGNK